MTLSSGWHWLVIALTVINIGACWWLMQWSGGQGDIDKDPNDTLDNVWDEDLRERNQPLPRWWLILFHLTILFSIGYLVLYPGMGNFQGTLGWSQVSQYDQEKAAIDEVYASTFSSLAALDWDQLVSDPDARAIGANLFGANCATCHGSDGGGAIGFPSLKDDAWLYGSDEATLIVSIANGRNGVMTPMGPALEGMGVSVDDMVERVLSLSGADHDPAAAERAASGWALCMACHGPEGKGNRMLGAPNLTDNSWLYGSSRQAIAQTIREGRAGQMPAQKDLLSADQIRVLAAYVAGMAAGG